MYRDDKIRGRQAEKNWSNEVLAEKAGVNINTITAVRAGKPVSLSTLAKITEPLELTLYEIFEPRPEAEPARV